MKAFCAVIGCVCILMGILCAAYVNVWMLITAIVNIYHGESIAYNVFMILFREVAGAFACFVCWAVAFSLFKASE
jgi:hypothetical protein